ncbi:transmembrane protein, putative [Medicago truncatula]|uniref:Transmembrane protein, putative n=1 Tax=Medicago truncatula TaxID=3880 RepID=A0A072V284_MEDTR|nr:transmembrane protein, putative [Medicago truncatula]
MIYSIVIINYLTTKKNQIKKKNQVIIPDVVLEITAILTIFEIMTILTKIEKCGSWERQN